MGLLHSPGGAVLNCPCAIVHCTVPSVQCKNVDDGPKRTKYRLPKIYDVDCVAGTLATI